MSDERTRWGDERLDDALEGVRHLPLAMVRVEGRMDHVEQRLDHQDAALARIEELCAPKPSTVWGKTKDLLMLLVPAIVTLLVGYLAFKGAISDIPKGK